MTLPLLEPSASADEEISTVRRFLESRDCTGQHMAEVIRETFDQVLNGRRTGRWDYQELHKTEKTFIGTLLEINLFHGFDLKEGQIADYSIEGIEVDCKYARAVGGWEIGPELVGHICLVVTASDQKSTWRAGLVRASEERLRPNGNRDQKRRLSPLGVSSIIWLWGGEQTLPPNQLLHMDPAKRDRIMSAKGIRSHGQARINALFKEFQEVVVRRVTTETVGHGLEDPLKRARSNGGARDALRGDGILVLGHQDYDPDVARALGLDVPRKGQFISVTVVPAPDPRDERPRVEIQRRTWVKARPGESPTVDAPVLPRKRRKATEDDEPE